MDENPEAPIEPGASRSPTLLASAHILLVILPPLFLFGGSSV